MFAMVVSSKRRTPLLLLVLLVVLSSMIDYSSCVSVESLRSYNISNDISVSGVSSGGYMAVQLHIAHSAIINGAGIFAGGPFYCAESNLLFAEEKCMAVELGLPETGVLVTATLDYAVADLIDSTLNLRDDHIYLFSGKDDTVVDPLVVKALQNYYQAFVDVAAIAADYNVEAEHCLPTVIHGNECTLLASPYIGQCHFDGAGRALQTIYQNSLAPATQPVSSRLFAFDQKPFIPAPNTSIGDVGYIYVPARCEQSNVQCKLHISFHGCLQNLELIGNQYASDTGFNEWAEANDIIVLYPYAEVSDVNPVNPNGCWDWWAYTDVSYGVKTGLQIRFVKAMIDQLTTWSVKY